MPQHISQDDHDFLRGMTAILEEGSRLSRAYLSATDPETRLATVTELARETISEHTRILGEIMEIMDTSTPADNPTHPDDVEVERLQVI